MLNGIALLGSEEKSMIAEKEKPGVDAPGSDELCYEYSSMSLMVAEPVNSIKTETAMTERFIKFIPSEEAMYLVMHKPNAFRLLTIVAERARRYAGHPDGLEIGEAFLGDWKDTNFSERQYRTAKDILVMRKHIKIIETCRTRKKSTTGATTVGTKIKLISSNVYDLNLNDGDDRSDDRPTTDRRQTKNIKNISSSLQSEDIEDSLRSSSSSSRKRSPMKPDMLGFSFEKGKFENITDADYASWAIAYPLANLVQEIAQAEQWVLANRAKAGKRQLWRKFLTGWFKKAHDRAYVKNAATEQDREQNQQKVWAIENRNSFFKWKNSDREVLRHVEYSNDWVINKNNGKEVSVKLPPEQFLEVFIQVAGVKRV